VFREYQTFSFNDSSAAWRALQKKTGVFERERMLSLLGPYIDSHNVCGLMQLSGCDSLEELFDKQSTDQARDQLALDIWEHAGAALVRSLDTRDPLLAVQTT
jgi:hypothetical protein